MRPLEGHVADEVLRGARRGARRPLPPVAHADHDDHGMAAALRTVADPTDQPSPWEWQTTCLRALACCFASSRGHAPVERIDIPDQPAPSLHPHPRSAGASPLTTAGPPGERRVGTQCLSGGGAERRPWLGIALEVRTCGSPRMAGRSACVRAHLPHAPAAKRRAGAWEGLSRWMECASQRPDSLRSSTTASTTGRGSGTHVDRGSAGRPRRALAPVCASAHE